MSQGATWKLELRIKQRRRIEEGGRRAASWQMGLVTGMVAICTQLGRSRLQEQGRGARWTSPCWLLRDNVCLQQDDEVLCPF